MNPIILQLFQYELLLQCKTLLIAADDLSRTLPSLNKWPRSQPVSEVDRVWIALQSLLVAAANISKLLWGSRGKREKQRAELRASIGITDSSPLRDVDLRNDFEHFDERLETWFAEPPGPVLMMRNIGPPNMVSPQPDKRFHHFDPATGEVTFWAHTSLIPPIVDETRIIFDRLQSIIEESH